MKETGFAEGLYEGEELNPKNFEDKDSKLGWLMKLITLVEMMLGEQIDIKPGMVLAGYESENTNFFLQQMFRAATAGVDTAPYVRYILSGGYKGEDDQASQ